MGKSMEKYGNKIGTYGQNMENAGRLWKNMINTETTLENVGKHGKTYGKLWEKLWEQIGKTHGKTTAKHGKKHHGTHEDLMDIPEPGMICGNISTGRPEGTINATMNGSVA